VNEIPQVAVTGINQLYQYGALVTLLVLIGLGLCCFCVYLLRRNNELADKFIQVIISNTQALVEFKETLKDVARKA